MRTPRPRCLDCGRRGPTSEGLCNNCHAALERQQEKLRHLLGEDDICPRCSGPNDHGDECKTELERKVRR